MTEVSKKFLKFNLFLVCILVIFTGAFGNDHSKIDQDENAEDQWPKQVFSVIEHFKSDDPVGLPSLPIPDPTPIPDVAQSISLGKLAMSNVRAHGTSKFRIQNVSVEVDKRMEAFCGVVFDTIELTGNYSLASFLTKSNGPFKIIIFDVKVIANASLAINRDGQLRANEIDADVQLSRMNISFSNLGFFASVFQSFANSAGHTLFENAKPLILKDAKEKMRVEIDKNIDKMMLQYGLLPNSITPIDYIIAEARSSVRKSYDPLKLNEYENSGIIGVKVFNTWIYGISSFYRVGDITFKMVNNSATINVDIGTQEIRGKTAWELSLGKGMITRTGNVQFNVQYIKVSFTLTQPVNLEKRMKIDDLQLNLGNIQIMSSGLGTIDYVIELFINVLPNLLRYQIMDAIEKPVLNKIQSLANKVDIEMMMKKMLSDYQKTGAWNFDLNYIEL